jgi:hypothetical protein
LSLTAHKKHTCGILLIKSVQLVIFGKRGQKGVINRHVSDPKAVSGNGATG